MHEAIRRINPVGRRISNFQNARPYTLNASVSADVARYCENLPRAENLVRAENRLPDKIIKAQQAHEQLDLAKPHWYHVLSSAVAA